MTLTAVEDDDALVGSAVIDHTVSGGDYGTVSATVGATESDDDSAALTLSATSVSVPEGSTAEYTVKLATRPSGPVAVTAERSSSGSPDADLKVKGTGDRKVLNFTTSDWNTAQKVILTASEDNDDTAGTAVISHNASGADYGTVTANLTATEIDNDAPGVSIAPTELNVEEGSSKTYTVVLAARPTAAVTVAPSSNAGTKATVSTSNGDNNLTFTTDNWNTAQTITVSGVAATTIWGHRCRMR